MLANREAPGTDRMDSAPHSAAETLEANRPLRVVLVERVYPHYRRSVLDRLASNFPDIKLEFYCGTWDTDNASISHVEDAEYVKNFKNFRWFIKGERIVAQPGVVIDLVRNPPDVAILESGAHILTNMLLIPILRARGCPTVVWGKGWHDPNALSGLRGWLRKWSVTAATHWVVYGTKTREQFMELGLPRERISVAQNTVEIADLVSDQNECQIENAKVNEVISSGRRYVFSIGRQSPEKRVDDVLSAFERVHAKHPDVHLIIAGAGPTAGEIADKVKDRQLDWAHVVGRLSNSDSVAGFRHAHVCVFPGAVGLAMNEAMAARTAVVIADEPGPDSELLEHELNGLRFPRGDIDALAASLDRVLSDDTLRERLAKSARKTILDRATPDKMAEGLHESVLLAYHAGASKRTK